MDIALLTDSTRCPDCTAVLPGRPVACPTCGLPLRGPLVDQLWQLSVQASELLSQRSSVLGRLRLRRGTAPFGVADAGWGGEPARVPVGAVAATTAPTTPVPAPRPGAATGTALLPQGSPHLPPGGWWADADPARDLPDEPVTVRQIQRLLLGLGVLLVAVAAVIFTVVAWGRVGIGGRTAILAGLTVASAAGTRAALRRDLPGTAESLATLTLGFCLLDAYGVRRHDLAGAGASAADVYWAVVVGGIAVLAGLAHRALPLRTLRLAAVLGVQAPLPILAGRLDEVPATLAFLAQGTIAVAGTRWLRGATMTLLLVGGTVAYVGSVLNLAALAYGSGGDTTVTALQGSALLLLAAVSAALLAWFLRGEEGLTAVGAAVATAALLGAAHAPMVRAWTPDSATTGGAALLLGVTVLLGALPHTRSWRIGPLLTVVLGAGAALLAVVEPSARAVGGELRWVDAPWTRELDASARDLLASPWPHSAAVAVTLALLTALATAIAVRLPAPGTEPLPGMVAGLLAVVTALVLPVALDASYLVSVLGLVGGGGVLVVAASRRRADDLALGLGTAGAALVGVGLVWSLAARPATPLALGGVLAAALAVRVAGTRARIVATVVATLALVAEAGVLTAIAGLPQERAGTAAVLAAGVLAVAAGLLRRAVERAAAEIAALVGGAMAFLTVAGSAQWSWISLLAAGSAAALVALRPDRHRVGWLAGALLTASSWVRLAMTDVSAPEAYTAGPAVALLVAGWIARRRSTSQLTSWEAYAPALVLGLAPSLAAALSDDGVVRPLLLCGVALGVLLAGVRSKLAAPLAIGGAVLAIDAVVQLGPYAAALPRWITIGAVGVLLLVLGATFERRLRDLQRVAAKLAELA